LEELVEERTAELRKANEQLQQEIVERKRAEESQAQLAAIVESSDDAIIGKTLDGIIFSWNSGAEKLYGYSPEEMKNHSISTLIPPNRPDEMPTILARIKHGENIEHYETIRIRKDGSIIYVSLTTSPIKDMAGNIIGVSTIARDVTERKRTEEEIKKLDQELKYQIMQLEAANKELEAFSYSVSHDLRAPLRAIDGFSRVMLEDYVDKLDDEGKRYLNIIRSNTQKMGQLIDDLLVFSRLGRQEIRTSGIDMGKLAKAVSEELKLAVPERKLKFTINTLIPAQGDQAMIRQVFINLLSNAVKFTKPKERALIEVNVRSVGDENVYTVKDNGVGFDMQYVNKLFGVFQRLHSSEEFEGTGVGLAIVQRIIHRHGGRVWAEGKVNEGATFYFTLPRERRE
jgi:PAS domain S-box-containing protein